MVFLVSTTLVAIIKREKEPSGRRRQGPEETQGVMETYKLLFSIIRLPTVFTFCSLLLTAKVGGVTTTMTTTMMKIIMMMNVTMGNLVPTPVLDGLLSGRRRDGAEAGGGRRP